MITFADGPVAHAFLSLRRCPIYLRVVRGPDGEIDALDQLDDAPQLDEEIIVYRIVGAPSVCFVDGTRNGRRCGRREVMARYAVVAEQPDDATVRDTTAWRKWCYEQQQRDKVRA